MTLRTRRTAPELAGTEIPDALRTDELLQTVVDNAAGALFLLDEHGYPVFMNAAACRMTGYEGVHEIRHRPLHYAIHFKRPDGSQYPMEECPIDQANAEIRPLRDQREVFCRKDGSLFPVLYNVAPVHHEGERLGVLLEVRDITLQVQREEERARLLRAAEAAHDRLRSLFMQAPAAIAIVECPDYEWSFVNPRYSELVGREPTELLGRRVVDVMPEVEEQGFIALLDRVRDTGKAFHADAMPLTLIQGEEARTVYVNFVYQPVRDRDGNVTSIMAHAVDVSAQVRAQQETKRLAGELEQRIEERTKELSAAVRELESFAYTVSHDLRAPLRTINHLAYGALGGNGTDLPPHVVENLNEIRSATQNMSRLIDGILILSGVSRRPLEVQDVDLAPLAEEILEQLHRAEPGRNVEAHVEQGLRVRGDPRLLRSILENLLGNAWKFTRGRDPARIDLGRAKGRPGAFIVRDNGEGFDMSEADALFVPFRRLHGDQYEGTGIGLATVLRAIERHGGHIHAESTPEHGTAMTFTLPDAGEKV